MTNVADVAEFEMSKENIQPIQQGRKAEVLKSALAVQPEDKLIQQRRLFEQELRSYSEDDPLSVWCRYIKWVEQNYPKGGREGNICKLIQQCLLILKDEKVYHNDDRFIDIWLKFANMSTKPLEVYSNMFSRGIGAQCARFYITWAWEAEQLGNLKRADEILLEGVRRNAQPLDTLKSTHTELEMRLTKVFGMDAEKMKSEQLDEPEQRSAFTMLKAQDKNKAPVSRIGDSTITTNRQNMTIRQQQQPQMKNSQVKGAQGKMPFKIYSGDSDVNSMPSQIKKEPSSTIHSEGMKENEKKPSKWTKVKVLQTVPHVREATKTQEFTVHCDNTPQPNSVKKVPQTSQVLSSRKQPFNPPTMIFEPPNPMMRPMYNKMKVYMGAEEFSFEELRAMEWLEKQRKAEKERKRLLEEQEKEELKMQMKKMQEKIVYLENLTLQQSKEKDTESVVSSDAKSPEQCADLKEEKVEDKNISSKVSTPLPSLFLTLSTEIESSDNPVIEKKDLPSLQQSNDFLGTNEISGGKSTKFGNTYMANEVDCMMRELYNGTLGNNTAVESELSFDTNFEKNNYKLEFDGLDKKNIDGIIPSMSSAKKIGFDFTSLSDALSNNLKPQAENKQVGFAIYHDPTEVIPTRLAKPASTPFPIFHDENQVVNDENSPTLLPQSISHPRFDDPKTCKTDENAIPKFNPTNEVDEDILPYIPGQDEDKDVENVPPADYVQSTEKRELAGILQPSKNIYYVPLEEQLHEKEKEIDKELAGGCLEGFRPLDENLTMLTAEQFAAAACFMSTPCVKPQSVGIRESVKKSDPRPEIVAPSPSTNHEDASFVQVLNNAFNLADSPKIRDILKQLMLDTKRKDSTLTKESYNNIIEMLKLCNELTNSEKLKSVLQQCASLIEAIVSKTKDFNQTNAHQYHTLQLSTIMETSRESKSSSSSGSMTSSMSKHKSAHNFSHPYSVSKLIKSPIPEVNQDVEFSEGLELGPHEKSKSEVMVHPDIRNEAINECNIDPFDPDVTSKLLKSLKVPVSQREGFYDCKDSLSQVKAGAHFKLGTIECMIENLYAEGAYAKVYSAQCLGNSFIDFDNTFVPLPRVAIKACKNANEWEFYVCSELAERLNKEKVLPDITNSILRVKCAGTYENGLVLVSDLFEQGTLLDVVNVYKIKKTRVPECLVMFFALEMLRIVSRIHCCGIVHADVKPDNFILNDIPAINEVKAMIDQPRCLRLIDFGRAIDLTLFKPGVTFSVNVKTDAFQCVQMREHKPWVYETDWYGVLGCIHILLFSEYMDVRKNAQGQWEPVQKFKRYFQNDVWQPLFHSLLNIPSPYEIPDLTPFVELLIQKLHKQLKDFEMQVLQLGLALVNRPRPKH